MSAVDLRVAIVLDPSLALGLLANTAAAIGIVGSTRPVPILRADEAGLTGLFQRAVPAPAGAAVVPFPRFARAMHDFADYAAAVPLRDLAQEPLDGMGLAGPAAWVRSLTGSLPLLR